MRTRTCPRTENGADASPTKQSDKAGATAPDKPSRAEINASVAKINETMQALVGSLKFSVGKDMETDVVRVVDLKTKEVIRQFPAEEILTIAKAIDRFRGDLPKETV
ncbi:MAG: flagellar protein FlaG [Rhodocyclaceae bacterium]